MKKFLLQVLLFVLPVIVGSYLIDIFLSKNLKKSNSHPAEFEVMNDIYDGKIDCDVAVYGSSKDWVQINSEILEKSLHKPVYNFGIDGHEFWLQYLRHLEFIKHNPKPKQIVVSVDLFMLQKRKDLYNYEQFLPYMLWNKNIKKYTSSYIGFNSADYWLPLIRYMKQTDVIKTAIRIFINPDENQKHYRNKGFKGLDMKWNSDFENARTRRGSYDIIPDSSTIVLFERFLEECLNSGIGISLVYCPEHVEVEKIVSNRSDLIDYCKKVSKKYNIPFLDYTNIELCHDKEYFFNSTHLNNKGADLFSKILANDLKRNFDNKSGLGIRN